MMKTYGVSLCLVALGLAGNGVPASHAQARMAAGEPGGGGEPVAASAAAASSAATASSSSDLRQRIEALKAELAELNSELAGEKSADSAASVPDDPQPQGASATAAPAQGSAPAAAPAAAAPMPLSTPSMSGPLSTAAPHEIPAGPFGKIDITGILSGIGTAENNHIPITSMTHADVSNAQVFVQKTSGVFQFYLQAGAYNIPALGTPFTQDGPTITGLYGPFPQGYLKLVKGNFNVEVGALPTLIGDEYTFTFENMNIERGLLWGQEQAVSRGVQLNDTYKKLTLAFSLNDGYYSNRYQWLSGSLAYAINSANTVTFVGAGNAGSYNVTTRFATPFLLDNSSIYNLIYTYTKGSLTISPYYQYNVVKKNTAIGIGTGSHTNGGALLVNYNFKHGFSLPARFEYIKSSTGNVLDVLSSNLLGFGPGTGAFSFTATPTWAKDGFFLRGDASFVHVTNLSASSFAFGPAGTNANQFRAAIETGFMF